MDAKHLHFSDFADEEAPLDGKKRKVDEILNTEILVTGYRVGKSKYKDKDYLTLQFENGNKKYIVFTAVGYNFVTAIIYLRTIS